MQRVLPQVSVFFLFFTLGCGGTDPAPQEQTITYDAVCDQLAEEQNKNKKALTLNLTDNALLYLKPLIDKIKLGLSPNVSVRLNDQRIFARGRGIQASVDYYYQDTRICDAYTDIHWLPEGKSFFIEKSIADFISTNEKLIWQVQDADPRFAKDKLGIKGSLQMGKLSRCVAIFPGEAAQAFWEVDFILDGMPYKSLQQGKRIIRVEPQFLGIDLIGKGQAQVYFEEPISSTNLVLKTVELPEVSTGGSLCNSMFRTEVEDGVVQAFNGKRQFLYKPNQHQFSETNVFYQADHYLRWLVSMLPSPLWAGPQVVLYFDSTNNGKNNTAVFVAGTSQRPPQIKLGQGDSKLLKNLLNDPEVVEHETGHAHFFLTLTSTTGVSRRTHEGLADSLVYAYTQNPCLGELICPQGSRICVSAKCLRSAENNYTLDSPDLPTDAHKAGQLISALFWDIGLKVGHSVVANLLVNTVFPKQADFIDAIQAVLTTDTNLYNGKYSCAIIEASQKRGFTQALSDRNLSCSTLSKYAVLSL